MEHKQEEPPLSLARLFGKILKVISSQAYLTNKISFFVNDLNSKAINNKKSLISFAFLLLISLMPWISEASTNKEIYAELMKYSDPLDPLKAGELTQRIAPLTPGLQEDPEDVTLSLMLQNDSYTLAQQLQVNANKEFEGPQRQEATYEVQKGETITQIAEKFDLHVASILDANDIKPEDVKKISPGTVIKIPSSDTSSSTEWLVAIKRAEEAERAAAAAEAAKKKKIADAAKAKALAASTKKTTSSGYSSVDYGSLQIPINGNGVSQRFGRGHTGIDFMASIGTPVYASASGKVVVTSTGWSGGYGNQIVVDHGGGRQTRYAHLNSFAVSSGEEVGKGQVIGYSGNTGRSTGPHLHFEVIIGGRPVAPPF